MTSAVGFVSGITTAILTIIQWLERNTSGTMDAAEIVAMVTPVDAVIVMAAVSVVNVTVEIVATVTVEIVIVAVIVNGILILIICTISLNFNYNFPLWC